MEQRSARRSAIHEGLRSAGRRTCDACAVRQRALCGALTNEELSALNRVARTRRLSEGQRIISDQEHSDHFGIVMSGTVKLTKVLPDGRQQIVALLFPSDFVGQPFVANCSYRAEAAGDVTLCTFPAAQFEDG